MKKKKMGENQHFTIRVGRDYVTMRSKGVRFV